MGGPSCLPALIAKILPYFEDGSETYGIEQEAQSTMLTIVSTVTLQPRDLVVSTNQSRANLSLSDSESLDMPVSVGPLLRGQRWFSGQLPSYAE